ALACPSSGSGKSFLACCRSPPCGPLSASILPERELSCRNRQSISDPPLFRNSIRGSVRRNATLPRPAAPANRPTSKAPNTRSLFCRPGPGPTTPWPQRASRSVYNKRSHPRRRMAPIHRPAAIFDRLPSSLRPRHRSHTSQSSHRRILASHLAAPAICRVECSHDFEWKLIPCLVLAGTPTPIRRILSLLAAWSVIELFGSSLNPSERSFLR